MTLYLFIRIIGVDAILAAFVTTLLLMFFYNTLQLPEFATRCLTFVQEHVFQVYFRVHCLLVSICVLHKLPLAHWVPKHNFPEVYVFSTLPTTSFKFAQARCQSPDHLRKTLTLPGLRPCSQSLTQPCCMSKHLASCSRMMYASPVKSPCGVRLIAVLSDIEV